MARDEVCEDKSAYASVIEAKLHDSCREVLFIAMGIFVALCPGSRQMLFRLRKT